jgi:hypothetical protein
MSTAALAQFKIKTPNVSEFNRTESSRPDEATAKTALSGRSSGQNRSMVMDDGYTFFDAEPVSEYDSAARLNKDVGWFLSSHLRVLGTFPKRSAFRVIVKKSGKKVGETRCNGSIYTIAGDHNLGNELRKKERDLTYEDFMYTNVACKKKTAVIKPIGMMNVEIHIVDGDTDEEKLVRTYKINVHRAPRVRGSATKPQPDVAHYYISRNAETGVAFGLLSSGNANYFKLPFDNYSGPQFSTLEIYSSYAPKRNGRLPNDTYARCSVNGQRLKLDWDKVNVSSESRPQEYAVYTDRLMPQFKRGSAYRDDIVFRRVKIVMPLYSGQTQYSKPRMKMEDTPGDWECKVLSNGELYRTFRWKVGADGKIGQHGEQKNGNINLFHNTFLFDMDIPEGGTEWDYRLMPMPNAGLFYGIPWTTTEGKAMAGKVPKKGKPFHVSSRKAGK